MKLKVRVTSPNKGLSRLARGISNINRASVPMGMFPSSGTGCGCFCGCCDCGCDPLPPSDPTVCNCEGCTGGIVRRWTLSVGNWTNDTCTGCSNATGDFILEYVGQSGTGSTAYCQFLSPAFTYCSRPVQWRLSANCNTTTPQSVELIHVTLPLLYAQYRKTSIQSGCVSNVYNLNANSSGCNVTASVSVAPIGICNCPPGNDCATAATIVLGVEYGEVTIDDFHSGGEVHWYKIPNPGGTFKVTINCTAQTGTITSTILAVLNGPCGSQTSVFSEFIDSVGSFCWTDSIDSDDLYISVVTDFGYCTYTITVATGACV